MVSVRRVAPILLVVAALPLIAAKTPATKSTHPPRELHRAGDHWTAYFPPDPATYPPGSKTYTIKRGDTLWTIAQGLYNNAYLWPQLWEANTWITDAHWIYPGDVLLVQGEVAQQAAAGSQAGQAAGSGRSTVSGGPTSAQAQPTQSGITPARSGVATAGPIPLGSEYDVYCYGYLGDPSEPLPNSVSGFEDTEMMYDVGEARQELGGSNGDLLFIDGGTATGLVAGDTYLVVRPDDLIMHPEKVNTVIGRHYAYRGQIRIIRADEHRACGVITQACSDIAVGDKLKPLPQIPIPLARIPELPAFCEPVPSKSSGYIVNSEGGWGAALGEGLLVEVNVGKADSVNPGDFLTVWRPSLQPGQPAQILGEIGILTSENHTATGRIVAMRYSMQVGDHVELR